MIKYLEILEQLFRVSTTSFNFGIGPIDEALGGMQPGVYGIFGPGVYPAQLALQCLQQNDDVCLYYGYTYPPLSAMHRLTAYGLRIPVNQLLVDTRSVLTRSTGFGAFLLRMRFMNFVDMFETVPPTPLSMDRLQRDINNVREKEEQLVVICIDDFDAWMRTAMGVLDAEVANPRRIALSLRDFSQTYQVMVLASSKSNGSAQEMLADISSGSIELEHKQSDPTGKGELFNVTVRTAISEVPLQLAYSNDLECFLDKVIA
jgi:hypothetical protein